MRTHTTVSVLVCVVAVTFMAPDASARWLTVDRVPEQPAPSPTPASRRAAETVSIADPIELPLNIAVSPDLTGVVAEMLRESGTFRRQIGIIGRRPELRVRIVLEDFRSRERAARAQCDLARYEYGAITALVHVWLREDAIELIAHELEHVIEFAEGANYRTQAVTQRGSVWAGPDAFETTRAIETGLQVKSEVRPALAARRR